MAAFIAGVDPDSKKHAMAFYIDGVLVDLQAANLMELMEFIKGFDFQNNTLLFSIENTMANQFTYGRNMFPNIKDVDSKIRMIAKISRNVGYNQHCYTELIRMLDHFKVKYVTFKPDKSNWAGDKENGRAQFERLTGWKKNSNVDTRSAAFFGFLALP